MSVAVLLGYGLAGGTSLAFAWIYASARYLLVKPSMLVLFYSHVFLQWPAAIAFPGAEAFLPRPLEFFLLIHGFVVAGLLASVCTWRTSAADVFGRLAGTPLYVPGSRPVLVGMAALVALGMFHYLTVVPLDRTGLIVAFLDPTGSAVAREDSLKLLSSQLTKYVFSITASSLIPMLGVMVLGLSMQHARQRRYGSLAGTALLVLVLLICISLTGARAYSALFLLTLVAGVAFSRGLRVGMGSTALAAVLVLAPAVFLSLQREGKTGDLQFVLEYIWLVVGYRMFELPAQVGLWYVHLAQTAGPLGISAIPKLAWLAGVPAIDAPNEIGLYYFDATLATVTANAGYLFSYYGYFGLASLVASLALLLLLDLALPVLRSLSPGVLLPAMATLAVNALSFVQMEYTIALVTNGFAITLAVAALVSVVERRLVGDRPPPSEGVASCESVT